MRIPSKKQIQKVEIVKDNKTFILTSLILPKKKN